MKISIVVPAFNEEKLLPATLQSIRAASAAFVTRGWIVELVVCDNNSTDRTADIARAEGAHVVFEPINQIARARNTGAAAATGDWIIFVDADSLPSRELFADVADAILGGRCLAGGVTVELDQWSMGLWFFTRIWNTISRFNRWCAGSFIFVDAEAFRAIGGFSHELFVSEELDLSQRLHKLAKQRGKRVVILRRHPLVTSARKVHLYGHLAHLKFLWRLVVRRGRVLRTRADCAIWYDGLR
ncbi:MAG TPA: glycosyltransferase [Candidatus Acidoferrum sp.]|nr:glycosyltransferase [Candidatus Acidoferrum sp.]